MPITRIDSSRDLLRIWFYWKRHAILIFIIIFIVVMGFAYLATPVYQASASIVILPKTAEGAVISSGTDENRIADVKQQDVNTEIELLYSDAVLRATIKSFLAENRSLGLRKPSSSLLDRIMDSIKKGIKEALILIRLVERLSNFDAKVALLRSSIEVEPIAMSNIISVTLEAERAKAAAIVLNRLLEVYIQHHGQVYTQDEGVDFYGHQLKKFHEKLAKAETELKNFQSRHSIINLERQNIANIDQMKALTDNLQGVEVSIADSQRAITLLKAGLNKGVTLTRDMKRIPAIAEIEKAIVPLYIEKSEILKNYTKNSREYQNVQEQIRSLQSQIRREAEKAIQTEELELGRLKARRDALAGQLVQRQKASNEISQQKKHFNELHRQVELYEKNFMLYSSKKEDALIYSDITHRNLANISISNKAQVPSTVFFPNRLLFLIISVVVGGVAFLGTPFLLEFMDHRLKFANDVEKYLGVPVISSIGDE